MRYSDILGGGGGWNPPPMPFRVKYLVKKKLTNENPLAIF
jgi:hypothetical protein